MTKAQAAVELVTHLDAIRVMCHVGIYPSNEDNIYSNRLREVIDHDHDTAADVASCTTCYRMARRTNVQNGE